MDASIQERAKDIERVQQLCHDLQAQLSRTIAQLDEEAAKFNSTASALLMIPSTAKNGERQAVGIRCFLCLVRCYCEVGDRKACQTRGSAVNCYSVLRVYVCCVRAFVCV